MGRIKNGTLGRKFGKKDNVFCIIYCRDATPYANYDVYKNSKYKENREKTNKKYPAVLAQMRHDCKIGFPGGKVDSDNISLIDALKKELYEEINLSDIDANKLEIISTFSNNKYHTTTFTYEVTFEEMIDIINNSKNAPHSFVENMGSFMLRLDSDSLKNALKHNFSGTGIEELGILIKNKKLLDIKR